MKPALVMPFHDPDGMFFAHLQACLPDLKNHFGRAYLSLPASTDQRQPHIRPALQSDDFFRLYPLESEWPIGNHFGFLYRNTAQDAAPGQVLHLCYPDRLAFALRTVHRTAFLAEIDSLHPQDLPLLFHRSPAAWDTHPDNYRRIEGFVTRIGENLFSKTLDYGWCHLVVSAGELGQVMQKVTRSDLSMVAEMVLHMQHHIQVREVDWLAWEDPFMLGRDPLELKLERENSLAETEKRLSYCLPMVDEMTRFAMNGNR